MSYKFEGSEYRKYGNLSTPEIAKKVRSIYSEKFPYSKISVRSNSFSGGSSIDVEIVDVGFNPFSKEYTNWLQAGNILTVNSFNNYQTRTPLYNDKALKILEEVEGILQSFNFDDSDSMSDYFHVNFYGHTNFDDSSHIQLYLPETAEAQRLNKYESEYKAKKNIQKEKRAEAKQEVKFKYGQVVTLEINWKGGRTSTELAIIKKVPTGSGGRFYLSYYDISLLKQMDEKELADSVKYENQYYGSEAKYGKNTRNKPIYLVYIDGKAYKPYHYMKNVAERQLSAFTGNYSHRFKEFEEEKNKPKGKAKKENKIIEKVSVKKATDAEPQDAVATIQRNTKQNGIEVKFEGFPAQEIRDYLKSNGFKWSGFNKVWYATYSSELEQTMQNYFGQKQKSVVALPPLANENAISLKAKALKLKRMRIELEY